MPSNISLQCCSTIKNDYRKRVFTLTLAKAPLGNTKKCNSCSFWHFGTQWNWAFVVTSVALHVITVCFVPVSLGRSMWSYVGASMRVCISVNNTKEGSNLRIRVQEDNSPSSVGLLHFYQSRDKMWRETPQLHPTHKIHPPKSQRQASSREFHSKVDWGHFEIGTSTEPWCTPP